MSEKALLVDQCPLCGEQFIATSVRKMCYVVSIHDLDAHGEIRPVDQPETPDFS